MTALQVQTQAAKSVIANWERGDLAAAVRALDASISMAAAAIAKAENRGSKHEVNLSTNREDLSHAH